MRRTMMVLGGLLILACCQAAEKPVYFKAEDGNWRLLPSTYDAQRGVVSFVSHPEQIRSGSTLVVLNLPPNIVLDDNQPPTVEQVTVDRDPVPDAPVMDLDWRDGDPRRISMVLRDAANPMDTGSVRVAINGMPADERAVEIVKVDPEGRAVRLTIRPRPLLRRQPSATNTISVTASDLSPETNTAQRTIRYHRLGEITGNPSVFVDSAYQGYEDLSVLVDGVIMEPGKTTYGVTWASEEQPGAHWVVLAWPQERELKQVEVFWAPFQGIFSTPQRLLVDVWEGGKWVRAAEPTNNTSQESTVIPLGGRKTSRIRLTQPDGMGHSSRPDIMWITEIKWE